MKKKRRLLALVLAACVTLQLMPSSASAAEAEVRDTEFFTPQHHADVNSKDMKYREFDLVGFQKKADELRLLAKDAANADAVKKGVQELVGLFDQCNEMQVLSCILFSRMLRMKILQSPCAASLDTLLPNEDKAVYLDYDAVTEEKLTLLGGKAALISEYLTASIQEYEVEYK